MASALVEAGAVVDAVDGLGCRPVHLFAAENHRDCLAWLVEEAGAEVGPDVVDHSGRSVEVGSYSYSRLPACLPACLPASGLVWFGVVWASERAC